ncbi:MAG: hypothetical protein JSR67_08440 [Proteobacteria bacterium]|nr:hypothetical protein [Pseudomonadota bacterium]
MSTATAPLYRELACAAAAALITLIASLSFVESTAMAPDFQARAQVAHSVQQADRA